MIGPATETAAAVSAVDTAVARAQVAGAPPSACAASSPSSSSRSRPAGLLATAPRTSTASATVSAWVQVRAARLLEGGTEALRPPHG